MSSAEILATYSGHMSAWSEHPDTEEEIRSAGNSLIVFVLFVAFVAMALCACIALIGWWLQPMTKLYALTSLDVGTVHWAVEAFMTVLMAIIAFSMFMAVRSNNG